MANCFCYVCNREVTPTNDFKCPFCHEDYLEYIESPQNNQRNQQFSFSANINAPFGINLNFSAGFNPFQIFNSLFNNRNQQNNVNQPNNNNNNAFAEQLGNIFSNVINRFLMPNQQNMNDYFFGSENSFQELIERLFRMNEQSLGSPPTDENFVANLKPIQYQNGSCIEDVCSICLDKLEEGVDVIVLPCRHGFHPDCIEPWLKIHSECPSCRHKLPSKQ